MFAVKATYRGETRKLSFSLNTFPSFEQLCNQLYRVFPISHNYHISKLLFSPNAAQGGRILIGREVHTVDDYDKSIRPYKDQLWPQGLLRFTIYDETPHKVLNDTAQVPNSTMASESWSPTFGSTDHIFAPVPLGLRGPISASHIPPPPIIYSTTSTASAMDVDNGMEDNKQRSTGSCCSVSSTKQEVQDLIVGFKEDLDRIIGASFGSKPSITPSSSSSLPSALPHPSPSALEVHPRSPGFSPLCSVCAQSKRCSWSTCERCHVVVCSGCSGKSPSLCFGTMGPHQWTYTPMPTPALPPWFITQPPIRGPWGADTSMQWSATSITNTSRDEDDATPVVPFIPPQTTSVAPRELLSCSTPLAQTVVHRGVICDICENTIEGIRHKCLDCPDYDLCTACITSGGAGQHNPFHEFFEIKEPGRVIVHTVNNNPVNARVQITAQEPATEPVSHYATCDLCDSRIQGDRYKCLECPDFDTCSSCFGITEVQHPQHTFARLRLQDDFIKRRHGLRSAHLATCNICTRHIFGVRFKCMHPDCTDFDLCGICEAHPIPLHPENHPLLKMKTPDTLVPTVSRVGPSPPANSRVPEPERHSVTVFDPLPHDKPDSVHSEVTGKPFVWGYMRAPSVSGESHPQMPPADAMLTPRLDEISPSITSSPIGSGNRSVVAKLDQGSLRVDITRPQDTEAEKPEYELANLITSDKEIETSAQEPNNLSRVLSGATWPGSASELAHLMQPVPLEHQVPSAPTHPRTDPVELPLAEQGILPTRPTEEYLPSTDMQQKPSHPVTLTQQTVSMLLSGYQLPSSVKTSSSVTSLLSLETKAFSQVAQVRDSEEFKELAKEKSGSEEHDVEKHVQEQAIVSDEKRTERGGIYHSATFIEDVTVPDGQIFPPGAEFMKCWKISNDSEHDWPETTELVYVAGERLGVKKDGVVDVGRVKAGAEVDLWTGELKAPEAAGRYVSYWRLREKSGQLFGGSIWIDIVVADAISDESDKSIASSIVIMPQAAPERTELSVRGEGVSVSTVTTLSVPSSSTHGAGSDAGSDVSLLSLSSSDGDVAWEDVASSVGDVRSETADYVLLYDDRSSEDE